MNAELSDFHLQATESKQYSQPNYMLNAAATLFAEPTTPPRNVNSQREAWHLKIKIIGYNKHRGN